LRISRQWGETSPQVLDELVQEAYLKFCSEGSRFIESFESTHEDAVFGYLKVFTANLVHDYFKRVRSRKRGGKATITSVDAVQVEGISDGSRKAASVLERDVLIHQVEACVLRAVSGPDAERDHRIFWLYYRTGLTASAIASLPGVGLTTKGVESTLLRLTRLVRTTLTRPKRLDSARQHEGLRQPDSF